MIDFLPAWVVSGSSIAGSVIGSVLITRSVAKRKIARGIAEAQAQEDRSTRSMVESQSAELIQLRSEVSNLRASVAGLTGINATYVKMLMDKDMTIAELHSDCRVKDELIRRLEMQAAAKA
jgi:hypothetical protein